MVLGVTQKAHARAEPIATQQSAKKKASEGLYLRLPQHGFSRASYACIKTTNGAYEA
jgi:hypothetical protein